MTFDICILHFDLRVLRALCALWLNIGFREHRPGLPNQLSLLYSGMAVPDTPIPNPAAVQEEGSDGWTLLVNPDTAGAMAINHTGALVWRLVDGRRTTREIVAAVRKRFPDAPDTVAEDVQAILSKLADEGFIGQEVPITTDD